MISEYPKLEAFKTTVEQSNYLKTLDNKSDFIRKAIDEAIKKNDKDKSDAEIIENVLPKSHIPEFGSTEWNEGCRKLFDALTIRKDKL